MRIFSAISKDVRTTDSNNDTCILCRGSSVQVLIVLLQVPVSLEARR